MQNYPTSPEIPSAQQTRRARFASQVAAATSTRFLKALAAFAETEFKDEPLKLKEALSRVACRMSELLADGLIRPDGMAPTDSGRSAIVYTITEAGRAKVPQTNA